MYSGLSTPYLVLTQPSRLLHALMNIAILLASVIVSSDTAPRPFAIEVIDEATLRGVPLVELTTTSGVTYVSDSAGLVAFDDPAFMKQRVFSTTGLENLVGVSKLSEKFLKIF